MTLRPTSLRSSLVALLLATAALSGCSEQTTPTESVGVEPEPTAGDVALEEKLLRDGELRDDPRMRVLLAGCSQNYYFDRDTGDVVGTLLDKLQHGGTDQLKRAKEELAALGLVALPEVERLLKRSFDTDAGFSTLQNTIDVLNQMNIPEAHDPLMKCLDHARDAIRASALRCFAAGGAEPGDYDRLLSHIPIERDSPRQLAAIALYHADPVRAANEYLDWFEQGAFQDLWPFVVSKVVEQRDPGVVARCGKLYSKMQPQVALWLAASAAAGGDPDALVAVNEFLNSPMIEQRTPALTALVGAGMIDLVRPFINGDTNAKIRGLAGQAALGFEPEPEWLREEMDELSRDQSSEVRSMALSYLLGVGDAAARDQIISMLQTDRASLQEAVLVLIPSMRTKPEFALRCLETLIAEDQKKDHLILGQRVGVLQAIGQLPLAEAASYLREVGLAKPEKVQGLAPHRFAMIQAANTGLPGRTKLIEHLTSEEDPTRRLDLIWSIASDRDELSRSFLIDLVQSDIAPYELLFAADRLARLGPTSRTAPVLKRVTLRCEELPVREALQCLLWKWY